jgi:putative OmpL-like beta-barrel porin-2
MSRSFLATLTFVFVNANFFGLKRHSSRWRKRVGDYPRRAFDPRADGGGRTTYGAIIVGITIKPPKPTLIKNLMIRPEIRYDRSLNGTHPFNDSSDQDMFTAAMDVVVTF